MKKNLIIWTTNDRKAKLSEIWDSWVSSTYIDTFGLVAFKVIMGLFGALAIFSENTISKKHFFYYSQPKFIKLPPSYLLNGPHKNTLWIFEFWKNSPLYPMGKPKTSIIWKTRDRRAKRSTIWGSSRGQ